jgi:hypothetical protein
MDTDRPVTSITADVLVALPPRENDTASGLDEDGKLFLWTYRDGGWTKKEPWSEPASRACVHAAKFMVLYQPEEPEALSVRPLG